MTRAMWMVVLALGCSGGGKDGGDDDDDDGTTPGATCEELCSQIEDACGADDRCVEECTKDQGNAESCDEGDEWGALLDCCDGADFAPYCADEDGFDPCQSGACDDLRPDGARSGC